MTISSAILPIITQRRLAALVFFLTLLLPSALHSATLTVPAQYAHIQDAINAAQNGDTVLIADGTYTGPGNVDLDFGGRNITVTSQNGPATTIIDCEGFASNDGSGNHEGFYFHSGETGAVVSGMTIENGYEVSTGGGIYIGNSSVSVQNCVISNCIANEGGGIYNDSSGGTIMVTNCTITGNNAQYGAGVYDFNINNPITLTNCTITDNNAQFNGNGGGVYNANYGGTVTMTNCVVTGDSAQSCGGGIYNGNYSGAIMLIACSIIGNTATAGSGVYDFNSGNVTTAMLDCTITGNTALSSSLYSSGGDLYPLNCTNCKVSIDPKGRILVCTKTSSPTHKSSPSCSKPKRANRPSQRFAASTMSPKTVSIAGAIASAMLRQTKPAACAN